MKNWRTAKALYHFTEISRSKKEEYDFIMTGEEVSAWCKMKNEAYGYVPGCGGDKSYQCIAVLVQYIEETEQTETKTETENDNEKGKNEMKYYNVTFKWYDTDTYCGNIAKAECVEDVKAHYAKYDSNPTITEASSHEVEAAKERGKPIVTCPHIEAPSDVEAEAEPEQTTTESTEADEKEKAARRIEAARDALTTRKDRSAWDRGVTAYALELLDTLDEAISGGYDEPDTLEAPKMLDRAMLNGARDWSQYSWGGSALIYDGDIAERLCNPSELKRTRNGERRPNSREEWLDTQARALNQAAARVQRTIRAIIEAEAAA